MNKITATEAKSITRPGLHRADDTLYLCVKSNGRRSWIQRVVIGGRRVDIGLGAFPAVPLAKARRRALENRAMIADGQNPLSHKRRTRIPTFREAAKRTHESLEPTWTSAKHAKIWMQVLDRHAMPRLADLPVDQITRQDVLQVLTPIWSSRPETAKRVRQRVRAIMKFCQAHGYVDHNEAGEAIEGALPSMSKVREHFRALDYREMPSAVKAIETHVESLPARLCLLFLILTASRSGEARSAMWSEINHDGAIWEIPSSRMKTAKAHRVPLSDRALEVLAQARPLHDDSDLVFPSATKLGIPMSSRTLIKTLEQIELSEKTVVHGFRTSFRTWASECTDIPREVCELALAHTVGSLVERSYARSDLLARRKRLMQLWSDFLYDST